MKRFASIIIGLTVVLSAMAQDIEKSFDFEKYRADMLENAFPRFMRSDEPVRFVDYALIDIDGDGIQEVWVRGDEGQAWQGVFSIEGDSVVLLADADVTSELKFYKNAVGYSGYISPGRVDEAFSVLKGSRIVASCEMHMEFNIFSDEQEVFFEDYTVNGKESNEEGYNAFVQQLGDIIPTDNLEWHSVK